MYGFSLDFLCVCDFSCVFEIILNLHKSHKKSAQSYVCPILSSPVVNVSDPSEKLQTW